MFGIRASLQLDALLLFAQFQWRFRKPRAELAFSADRFFSLLIQRGLRLATLPGVQFQQVIPLVARGEMATRQVRLPLVGANEVLALLWANLEASSLGKAAMSYRLRSGGGKAAATVAGSETRQTGPGCGQRRWRR